MRSHHWICSVAKIAAGLLLMVVIILSASAGEVTFAQEHPQTYVITSQDRVNARACPQLTCAVVVRLSPGAELVVIEIVPGDPVNGNDQWLHISLNEGDAYVHSSLAAPLPESDAQPVEERTTVPDPAAAEAYYERGNAHFSQGNFAPAIAYYDEAVRRNPDHLDAYYYQAIAYYLQDDYDAAIGAFSEVIRINPDHANAYFNRGCLYSLLGEDDLWTADLAEYGRILDEDGLQVTIYWPCTNLMERALEGGAETLPACADTDVTGIPQPECEALDVAVVVPEPNAHFYYRQANEYRENGQFTEAIAAYDEAIRLDPEFANAYYNRGITYAFQGDFNSALADLNHYISLVPDDPEAFNSRGAIYSELGNYSRAITDLDEAIRLDPEYVKAYFNRGYAYTGSGNYTLAVADFDEVVRLDPEFTEAYYWRGLIYYYELGEDKRALADLREYRRLAGADADPEVIDLLEQLEAELGASRQTNTGAADAADANTFTEDFSDNSQGWYTDRDLRIQNGVFQITIPDSCCYYYVNVPDQARADFTLTVDVSSETNGAYYIIFRAASDTSSGYFFGVDTADGMFVLQLRLNNEWQNDVIFWQASEHIVEDATNQLGIVAYGDQIRLYINGIEVGSVTDNQLQTGSISLAAVTYVDTTDPIAVQFDNLLITPETTFSQKSVDCTDSAATGVSQEECKALLALYNSTNGPGWEAGTNWVTTAYINEWYGITVRAGHVAEIDLHENQLTGNLPDLSALTHLSVLNLSDNQLSGNLPDLSALSALTSLNLSDNQLTGSIPDLSNLTRLFSLSLFNNQLSGSIPDLSALTQLYSLDLTNNQLSGSIPDLTGLTHLYRLNLSNNQLVSDIPPSITHTAISSTLNLCGGDNNITSSDPEVTVWVQERDENWTQGCGASEETPLAAQEYTSQGIDYLDNGNYEAAVAAFDEAIRLEPDDPTAYHFRGLAYYSLGEYEQAIADFDRVIELDPENALAFAERGNAYDDLGNFDQAIADYTQAIALDPRDVDFYFNRGLAYARHGDFEEAIADFSEAIRINPDDAEAYFSRGNVYYWQGDYTRAIADYDQASRINPDFAAVYNMRAYAYFQQGDVEQALADVTLAIELRPDAPGYLDSRCEFYLKSEQWEPGVADCEAALELGWEFSAEMQALLAEAYEHLDRPTPTTQP